MWKALVVALAGCASATPAGGVLSNGVPHTSGAGALFDLDVGSLGPITGTTRATTDALQAVVGSRYTVKPIDRSGVEYHVFLGDELLFYVIPNDDGSLFNIHAVSSKVTIAEHPEWVIGSPFHDPAPLTSCECWGQHPVCFRSGDHVAVAFEIACSGLDTDVQRRQLEGVPIQRAVWNPRPFGGSDPRPRRSEPPSLSKMFSGESP